MPKFANIFLFNRLLAPGGGGTLYYGFSGSKVTTINYLHGICNKDDIR